MKAGADGYRSRHRDSRVFPEPAPPRGRLVLEVSGQLKKYGLRLPDLVSRTLGTGKTAWQVTVHLQTDENGHVEHVFLDKGCDDTIIDQRVIKAMYRGRLIAQSTRCEGTVTASFPGE